MTDFSPQDFSRDLKIAKARYVAGEEVDADALEAHMLAARDFDVDAVEGDGPRKALWINIYNGFTNYLIIKRQVRGSMMRNPTIFFMPKMRIGAHRLSLDDIEHGILRNNRRAPYKPVPQFILFDVRKRLVSETADHRIHFALNCGALSCPPIAFYDAPRIEEQLALAEKSFTDGEFVVDADKKIIRCSEIFRMYRGDFRGIYLNDPAYRDFKIMFTPYNWTVA